MDTVTETTEFKFQVESGDVYTSAPKFYCNGFKVIKGEGATTVYFPFTQGGQTLTLAAFLMPDFTVDLARPQVVDTFEKLLAVGGVPASAIEGFVLHAGAKFFYGNFLDLASLGPIAQLRISFFSARAFLDGGANVKTKCQEIAVVEMSLPVLLGVIKAMYSL